MNKPKNIFVKIAAILLCVSILNIISPVSKQEIVEIAKSKSCSVKIFLKHLEDSPFDRCIGILSQYHFKQLSLDDKRDIAINFILYSDLDAGSSVAFVEMIFPYKKALLKSMEDISDLELKQKYQVSDIARNNYRQSIKHYKKVLCEI